VAHAGIGELAFKVKPLLLEIVLSKRSLLRGHALLLAAAALATTSSARKL
jgi:hypothetical protein